MAEPAERGPLPHDCDMLVEFQSRYGDRWQVENIAEIGWVVVRRPKPTAQRVLAARTLSELASKMNQEENGLSAAVACCTVEPLSGSVAN